MDSSFRAFDLHRMFIGDTPWYFIFEVIVRTLIMYSYTVFLLRILGKRGMGQLSMLELAIIISFGSAIGDPMVGAQVPILYGLVAVTIVTFYQIWLERLINKNKKIEAVMEGKPDLIVDDGVILWECMKQDNLSKEDLFRALRIKDVDHLGQISKAYFETTGQVSVFFHPPRKMRPGLTLLPEGDMGEEPIKEADKIPERGVYACANCGYILSLRSQEAAPICPSCDCTGWVKARNEK